MPKALKSMDRRRSGPFFYLAIIVMLFALYSMAVAWATVNDCDGYDRKTWQVFPPEWECQGRRGFG